MPFLHSKRRSGFDVAIPSFSRLV